MKQGHLSQYFSKVVAKRLSAVEADPKKSNQHEFNGTAELKRIFGTDNPDPQKFETRFVWIGKENEALSSDGFVTWYDARRDHPTRTEFRLYFKTTDVSELAREGDLMVIAQQTDGSILVIIVASDSTIENQLLWLFDLDIQGQLFVSQQIDDGADKEIDFIIRFILEEIGIEVEEPEATRLDELLEKFNGIFPTTKEFSLFARSTISEVSPIEEPDITLMKWMTQEEKLFRRLERQMVAKRISKGFESDGSTDVDGFVKFSLSVHNRRKSRAGYALEHHLAEIFDAHDLFYSRQAKTEGKKTPDFLFPGESEYHDSSFSTELLTMLGVKTSCKDRWRQVLSEAARIENKHLFTMEPGISTSQTDEMISDKLQLVVPQSIHETFTSTQQSWLLNLGDFINLVQERQDKYFE